MSLVQPSSTVFMNDLGLDRISILLNIMTVTVKKLTFYLLRDNYFASCNLMGMPGSSLLTESTNSMTIHVH